MYVCSVWQCKHEHYEGVKNTKHGWETQSQCFMQLLDNLSPQKEPQRQGGGSERVEVNPIQIYSSRHWRHFVVFGLLFTDSPCVQIYISTPLSIFWILFCLAFRIETRSGWTKRRLLKNLYYCFFSFLKCFEYPKVLQSTLWGTQAPV